MFNMLLEDIQITPIIYQNSVEAVYLTETAIGTLATVAELLVTDYIMFTIPALSILIGYKLYSYFSYVKPLVEKPIVDDNLVSEVIENIVPEVIENVVPEVVMIPVPVSLIAEISRASFILTNFLNIYTEGIFRALRVGHTHPQDAEKIIEFINVVEEYTERLKDLIQILLSQVPYP
jgi:hypothetical protein